MSAPTPRNGSPLEHGEYADDSDEGGLVNSEEEKDASKLGSNSVPAHIPNDEDDEVSGFSLGKDAMPGEVALEDADDDG